MPVPDYETLMRPVLQGLANGATKVSEVIPGLVEEFGISPEEAEALIPSGRVTVLANRAHWARTYLSKAGALESPRRNHHVITELGRSLLARHPERIDNTVLAGIDGFEVWRTGADRTRPDDDTGQALGPLALRPSAERERPAVTPEETMESIERRLRLLLAEDLLNAVHALSPDRFEQLIVDLLIAMGYGGGSPEMGRKLGKSGDGGIDGVIDEDALGLDAVYIQAKRHAEGNTIGRPALQAFVGSLTGEGATKGVFVTTSAFTAEARAYVDRVAHRIVLIDGAHLARLMIAHGVGVRTRRTFAIQGVDEDYFADT